MSDQGWGESGGYPEWNQPVNGEPVYGEPQYRGDQYGSPYGPPQYGPPYGQQQYGQQQYGQQQYGGPPPAGPGGNQKALFIGLGAVIMAGLVVLVLALTGAFSGDGSPAAGPAYSPTLNPTFPAPSLTAHVAAPGPTSVPTGSSSFGIGSLCASSVSATTTVRIFIGAITLSSIDLAEGCVYQGRVSRSKLESITGPDKIYAPTVPSGEQGPTFTFTSIDGNTTLKVRVDKHPDGKYYVTDVAES